MCASIIDVAICNFFIRFLLSSYGSISMIIKMQKVYEFELMSVMIR